MHTRVDTSDMHTCIRHLDQQSGVKFANVVSYSDDGTKQDICAIDEVDTKLSEVAANGPATTAK
jgi:hypothetical protein